MPFVTNLSRYAEGATHTMHSLRRSSAVLLAITLGLAVVAFVAPTARANEVSSVAIPVVHIDGRGHGHGVGMSQWGAFTMANNGATAAQIMATFYPGTQLSPGGGEIIVGIHQAARARVSFPGGGQIRSSRGEGPQAAGFPVQVAPGQVVEIVRGPNGIAVVGGTVTPQQGGSVTPFAAPEDCFLVCLPGGDPEPGGTCTLCLVPPTTQPPATTTPPSDPTTPGAPAPTNPPTPGGGDTPGTTAPPPAGPPVAATPVWAVPAPGGTVTAVDRGRNYRGTLEVVGSGAGVRVRNHVDIEDYLKGMAEVPGSWPAAAVQAQAIAARTYALRAAAGGGELCDTESCQVYVGTSRESVGQSAAVDATRNVVVTYNGALAATFYSATGGGYSATADEGFGSGVDVPYLQAAEYPDSNPQPYALDIALTDVAARLGYAGTITDVRVDRVGPSGRALQMSLAGTAGVVDIDPQDFRRELGLRSTLFTVTMDAVDTAPAPPAAVTTAANDVVGAAPEPRDRVANVRDVGGGVRPRAQPLALATGVAPAPQASTEVAVGLALAIAGLVTVARLRAVRLASSTTNFIPVRWPPTPMSPTRRRLATMVPWRRHRP